MFIPVANTMQVEMIYTVFGQSVENVFHVRKGSAPTLADLQAVADIFDSWHNVNLKTIQSLSAALRLIVVRGLASPGDISYEKVINPVRSGTVGVAGLPGNVTCVITWTTGLRGRSFRGRTYHIGLPGSGWATGNQLVAAGVTQLVTHYTALLTNVNAGGTYSLGIVSRRANNQWRQDGVFTPITGLSVEGNLDSQRRRLTGPGRGS